MKINKIILSILTVIALILSNSCQVGPDEEAYFSPCIIVMNIDGSEQKVFLGNSKFNIETNDIQNICLSRSNITNYNFDYKEPVNYNNNIDIKQMLRIGGPGYPVAMNDNQKFIVCSENLNIYNIDTNNQTRYLEDIDIDYMQYINGIETIGVSYDDNYIAFTSDNSLYCFNLSTLDYDKITSNYHDEFPKFGIDGRIYFSRKDGESYKLMSIEKDGNNIQEICQCEEQITHIFPGKIDSNVVYLINNSTIFNKVLVDSGYISILYEMPIEMSLVGRSNDDHYFSFSRHSQNNYLYDTATNTMQVYFTPSQSGNKVSKILPDKKVIMTKTLQGPAVLTRWDIDGSFQIGESNFIEDTREYGETIFCFTPNGEKVIFIHIRRVY